MASVVSIGSATSSQVLQRLRDGLTAQSDRKDQPSSTQAATSKQATITTETPQEEAMETYAETLMEALSGNQQAMKKLAAEEEKAATERAPTASARQGTGTNGEIATTTQATENGINTVA